jgi:hypothetical protein
MKQPPPEQPPKAEPPTESVAGFDPALDAALKRVLEVIYKEHPLEPNQILTLASELQRMGVHRLVEEHLRKFRRQEAASD